MENKGTKSFLEDNELTRVPTEKRTGFWAIVAVLMNWIINPTPAITGGSIASEMMLTPAILAIFVGAIVLGAYSLPLAVASANEGLSTSMISRSSFGDKGANIVSAAMAIANVIFYGVVVGVFVMSLEGVVGVEAGSFTVWGGIVFAVVMATSAFFGYKGVELLSKLSVIPMMLLFLYAAYLGIKQGGGWNAISQIPPASGVEMPFGLAVTGTIGIFTVGATLTGDVTRYGKPGKKSGWASFVSFGIGFAIFVSLGAIAVKGTGMGDLISVIVQAGGPVFTVIGFALLLISSWSGADNNVYSAGLALSKIFKAPKYIFTIITAAIGMLIAATGVYNNLFIYLGILAMLIPPIGIIIAIDYFYVKKDVKDKMANIVAYNWEAIIAWGIAVVADLLTANNIFGGYVFGRVIGVSGINSLVIAGVVYFILAIAKKKKLAA